MFYFLTYLDLKVQSALRVFSPCFCENLLQIKHIRFVFQANKTNGLNPGRCRQVVRGWLTYHMLVLGLKFPLL